MTAAPRPPRPPPPKKRTPSPEREEREEREEPPPSLPPPSRSPAEIKADAEAAKPPVFAKVENFLEHLGQVGRLFGAALRAMFRRPFEFDASLYQLDSIGVKSLGIASISAIFVGMVMAVQFVVGLQKFGGMEYTGRIVGLSFSRELAPTLTAIIVGGRIGSGIAAEVGSMAVTEQIDAIRALGADPVKKLVVPRLIASVITLPILGAYALILGFCGAMFICQVQFNINHEFFLQSAVASVGFRDLFSGLYKCPFFGAIIALVGCHFGLVTRGGTEGVGQATTRTVVVTSIAILIADFVLTKLAILMFHTS